MEATADVAGEVGRLFAQLHEHIKHLPKAVAISDTIQVRTAAYVSDSHPLDEYRFTRYERIVADLLFRRLGRTVSRDAIMDACYFDRADPPDAKIIDIFIYKIRGKLIGSAYGIQSAQAVGYRMVELSEEFEPVLLGQPTPAPKLNTNFWQGVHIPNKEQRIADRLFASLGQYVQGVDLSTAAGVSRDQGLNTALIKLRRRLKGKYLIENDRKLGWRMVIKNAP